MSNGLAKREIKMTSEYISTNEIQGNVEEGGIVLMKREDGNYALPGGGHVTNEGYARQIAKKLAYANPSVKSPMANLANKVVTRLSGVCSDTSVMSA